MAELENMSKQGRPFVHLILFPALTVLLFLLGASVPVLGFWGHLVCPLPLALLGYRDGARRMDAGALLAATVMALGGLFNVLSPLLVLYFLLGFLPLSLALYRVSRRKWTGTEALVVCVLVALLTKLAVGGTFLLLTGTNPWIPNPEQVRLLLSQFSSANSSRAAAIRVTIAEISPILPYVLPSLLLISSCLDAVVNYRLCERFQRGSNSRPPSLPPFTNWRFSNTLLPALFFSFVMGLLWDRNEWLGGAMFAANLKLVLNILFFVQGLSLAFWWASRRLGPLGRAIMLFVLLVPVMWICLLFLGIADMLLDFRSRAKGTGGPNLL